MQSARVQAVQSSPSPTQHHHDLAILPRGAPAPLSHCCDALTQPSTTLSLRTLTTLLSPPRAPRLAPVATSASASASASAPAPAPVPADLSPRPATINLDFNHDSAPNQRPPAAVTILARVPRLPTSFASPFCYSLARLSLRAPSTTCSYAPPGERAPPTSSSLLALCLRPTLRHLAVQQSVRDALRPVCASLPRAHISLATRVTLVKARTVVFASPQDACLYRSYRQNPTTCISRIQSTVIGSGFASRFDTDYS